MHYLIVCRHKDSILDSILANSSNGARNQAVLIHTVIKMTGVGIQFPLRDSITILAKLTCNAGLLSAETKTIGTLD